MSEHSQADIWANDLDLPTLPGLETLFGLDDLKGSLRHMPDAPVSDTKAQEASMNALNKAVKEHREANNMSVSNQLGHSGEGVSNANPDMSPIDSQVPSNLDDGLDIVLSHSNPETPQRTHFNLEESPALKRVHSEQGPRSSSSRLYGGTVNRYDKAHDLNSSLLNTPAANTIRRPRPASRLREDSLIPSTGGPGYVDDRLQDPSYDRDVGRISYGNDHQIALGQHIGRSHYPDPAITQSSFGVISYSGLPNLSNESLPQNNILRSQQDLIPNTQTQSLVHPGFDTLKKESPEFMADGLVYTSFNDANRDRATNTLVLNDRTVPHDEYSKQLYVNTLKEAMMEMRYAEDNDGMISTWNKMRQDKNKVEQACWALIEVVMRAYNPSHIGPLVAGTKPTKYESFQKRIDALVDGLRTQKTMCKHIMAPPYVDQLVDDPLNAITRIKNNRKVNLGKKVAIQKGRFALGEKGAGKGRRNIKVAPEEVEYEDEDSLGVEHDNVDAEYDLDDEEPPIHQAVASRRGSTKRKRSDDENDPSYALGHRTSKKAKRPSRSMYQVDENNRMVDTSQVIYTRPEPLAPEYNMRNRIDHSYSRRRPIHPSNLQQQAHLQERHHTDIGPYHNPYAPTAATEQVPDSQALLPDYDNKLYDTSTAYTSANELDNDYHQYNSYRSGLQHGGVGGHLRHH